ncbi:MAG: cytochrome c [Candidatus Tumulicola sp.]
MTGPGQTPQHEPVSISVYLDDSTEAIATYRPPARFSLDTTRLSDGDHVLRLRAIDALGNVGVRAIPFTAANGPGITVTGLRAGSRVRGCVDIDLNAFSAAEPFDPVRAESSGPIPVWTWVLSAVIAAWAAWYGIEYFATPAAFAATPTYAVNPALAAAQEPATSAAPGKSVTGGTNVAGFEYAALGARTYAASCSSCHGESGAGVPGAFPALAGDAIVNGSDADAHIKIVLRGLSGKVIGGAHFGSQMPAFAAQLSDPQIAAAIDHERTSWGNHAPLVTPSQVKSNR